MRRNCEFCRLLVVALLAATGVASASTIHVPGGFGTIGAAVTAASSGDTILVAAGTYTGLANRNLDFGGKSLTLIGTAGSSATIIDCEQHARGLYFHMGEDGTSIVSGFTIRNGNATEGGGIMCEDASPTIVDCVLVGNSADLSGGGLFCYGGSPTVDHVRFESNVAVSADMPNGGGGVCLDGSSPSISGCEFVGNSSVRGGGIHCRGASLPQIEDATFDGNEGTAGGGIYCREQSAAQIVRAVFTDGSSVSGGGIYADASAPSIQECFFNGNIAVGTDVTNGGGAIHLFKSSATIERCAFIDNVGVRGGAVHVRGEFAGVIEFSTFAGNYGQQGAGIYGRTAIVSLANCILASGHGVAIYCAEDASINLSCSDIFGNSGGDWVNCAASQLGLNGNIWADPLFCGGSDPDEAYALQGGSPCAAENCLCGQMGRWGVACAGTAVQPASWGGIKARYR